ncbi:hypothetical protein BD779DRAFT_1559337 [Infundibulicybe gibba]|nr:hypothetical protein BD779DRAFT_1559337 [Infundibulicybe gibba]
MSSKGGYNATAPKYINDFSKALASEVRILLDEVGKLRDERRALQFEIAELMSVKSKHGAGGEYSAEWRPPVNEAPSQELMAPAPPPPEDAPAPARPGWRTIHKRPEKKERGSKRAPPTPASPPPAPLPEPPRPGMPAWAQWRPNPLLAPTPIAPIPTASIPNSPPARSGLFGPSTPPPQ